MLAREGLRGRAGSVPVCPREEQGLCTPEQGDLRCLGMAQPCCRCVLGQGAPALQDRRGKGWDSGSVSAHGCSFAVTVGFLSAHRRLPLPLPCRDCSFPALLAQLEVLGMGTDRAWQCLVLGREQSPAPALWLCWARVRNSPWENREQAQPCPAQSGVSQGVQVGRGHSEGANRGWELSHVLETPFWSNWGGERSCLCF